MLADNLTADLIATLHRPDLSAIASPLAIRLDPDLGAPFRVTEAAVILGHPFDPRHDTPHTATLIRQAIELHRLLHGSSVASPSAIRTAAALFVSARIAALFHRLEHTGRNRAPMPGWLAPFADNPPQAEALARVWPDLAQMVPTNSGSPDFAHAAETLATIWPALAPAEWLMAEGGDARLANDPETGLNRYGCSHRPRPWAITFASTTASSVSERGFAGAEAARRTLIDAVIDAWAKGHDPVPATHAAATSILTDARTRIARAYHLDAPAQVLLCASGTDCELAALAIAIDHARRNAGSRAPRPIANMVIAPDETGSGVPLAAEGRHFAGDTASDARVAKGMPIAGFPSETVLIGIPLRTPDGTVRTPDAIDAECLETARAAAAQGQHVLLHVLDMSKTGLIGPSNDAVARLVRELSPHIDIVIDACQARIIPARLGQAVRNGAMALITGSKFFTGPPFCGAVLLPPETADSLPHAVLPAGLRDYANASEWPRLDTPVLGNGANTGLALRWHASLAEMDALLARRDTHATLTRFTSALRGAIEAHPDLDLLPVFPLDRPRLSDSGPDWDTVPTILSFLVRARGGTAPLALLDTRNLYHWLNADLSGVLPATATAAERALAATLCHIGQPVPVIHPDCPTPDRIAGALRLSAGARLVSGEPSHDGIGHEHRIAREIRDALHVLDKISLILKHRDTISHHDPKPTYN